MNDLKSDLFPSPGCLQGDVAQKGEELGWRGRGHLGGKAPAVFGESSGGDASRLSSSHIIHGWYISFMSANEE